MLSLFAICDQLFMYSCSKLQNLEELRGRDKESALSKLSDLQQEGEVTDGIVRDLRDEMKGLRQEVK